MLRGQTTSCTSLARTTCSSGSCSLASLSTSSSLAHSNTSSPLSAGSMIYQIRMSNTSRTRRSTAWTHTFPTITRARCWTRSLQQIGARAWCRRATSPCARSATKRRPPCSSSSRRSRARRNSTSRAKRVILRGLESPRRTLTGRSAPCATTATNSRRRNSMAKRRSGLRHPPRRRAQQQAAPTRLARSLAPSPPPSTRR
mmetsp:Transcript_6330/g.17748  ORF Transcript_6330/g.17748 Transcript_6330/m.17748 type:complete len:200 (+) Transcript_6330:2293-2892(+)